MCLVSHMGQLGMVPMSCELLKFITARVTECVNQDLKYNDHSIKGTYYGLSTEKVVNDYEHT